ncbi:MAG: winged helix-turn-helix transcriptional regulator, partial [Candidatus Thermoplasmatota archaeon]
VESKAEVEFEVISTQTPPKVKVWIDKFSKDKEEYTENETISLNATILMGLECVVCPQFLEDFNFSVLIYDANGTVISEEKKSFKISSSNNITNLTFQFKLEHGYYKAKGILSNASGILDEMEIKINITAKVEHIIWIEELTTDKKIYKIGERVNGIVDIRGKFIQAVLKLRVIDDHNEIIYEESKDLIPGKSLFEFELRKAGNFTIKAELRYNEEVMDYKETKIIVRYIEKKHLPTIGIEISTGIGFLSVGIFLLAFIAKTELGKYNFFTFFFVPLYTKLRREKILDHYTRGKIHGYIIANPGEHYNAIKSALGINNGTLAYHLTVLLREGYIVASSDRLYKRFYPVGMKIPNGKQLSYAQKLILEIVKANPGISQIDIANKLNTSIQVINYHIKILVEGNILHVERVGKATKLYLKENNN